MPENGEGTASAAVRPFWSGTVSFGLVSVPVNVLPAVRSSGVSLRMVSPEGHPLERRYFTSRDDRELSWDEIIRGYEVEKDKFVPVEDDELERLAPERTRDIDLRQFVKLSDIDPALFERAYYLTPAGNSTKAYRLLAKVMEDTGRAGIATFVMRAKEYLVAIIAENGILRAETLRFADDLRSPDDVGLDELPRPKAADVTRVAKEINRLTESKLAPSELKDEYAERVRKLVAKKARSGQDVVGIAPEPTDDGEIIDLVEMLQRSLSGNVAGKRKGASPPAGKRAPRKKARA